MHSLHYSSRHRTGHFEGAGEPRPPNVNLLSNMTAPPVATRLHPMDGHGEAKGLHSEDARAIHLQVFMYAPDGNPSLSAATGVFRYGLS
jgi:hypothetical protein